MFGRESCLEWEGGRQITLTPLQRVAPSLKFIRVSSTKEALLVRESFLCANSSKSFPRKMLRASGLKEHLLVSKALPI